MHRQFHVRLKQFIAILAFVAVFSTISPAQNDNRQTGCSALPSRKLEPPDDCPSSPVQGSEQGSEQHEDSNTRSPWRSWTEMAARAQATEPDWLSPLVTTSGRLKNELRFDFWDQPSPPGSRLYQFGGNKGLEFITSSRTQVLLGVPTYELQSPNGPPGGWGDWPLMLKFRIASSSQREKNYLLTFLLSGTVPTGSHRYGSGDGVLTPTLAVGKGWRNFDAQSTFGMNLPTGDTVKLGRQLSWNTAFQYRAPRKLWPELEVNSTFYETGKDAGDKQVFLTPALGFGRTPVSKHFRFSSAAGMQIAATRFHTYNHRLMLSTRLSF